MYWSCVCDMNCKIINFTLIRLGWNERPSRSSSCLFFTLRDFFTYEIKLRTQRQKSHYILSSCTYLNISSTCTFETNKKGKGTYTYFRQKKRKKKLNSRWIRMYCFYANEFSKFRNWFYVCMRVFCGPLRVCTLFDSKGIIYWSDKKVY